jgi:hypothetical protein
LYTPEGRCHAGFIGSLDRIDVIVEIVDLHVVGDDVFTAPARRAGGQVGLAVAVVVKGLLDLVALEVIQRLDVVLFHLFFGYQIALETAGFDHISKSAGLIVEVLGQLAVMVREPAVGPVVHIAKGNGLVENRFCRSLGVLTLIAQFFQAAAHQGFLKKAGVPGGAGRLNCHPFARHVVGGHHRRSGHSQNN